MENTNVDEYKEIEINNGELLCLRWLTDNGPNVDKAGAIIMTGMVSVFDMSNPININSLNDIQGRYNIPFPIISWIKNRIEICFATTGIPAKLAIRMYLLQEKLQE